MRRSSPLIVLSITAALCAPVAAQQPGRLVAKLHTIQRPQAAVTLENLPREMISLGSEGNWQTATLAERGLPGARRTALPSQRCLQPSDSIDLRRLRMSGFAVTGHRLITDAAPQGYTIAAHGIVNAYRRDGARLVNARTPAEIDVITVLPTVWVLDIPVRGKTQRMGCAANWRLEIKASGPAGVDPLNGWRQ